MKYHSRLIATAQFSNRVVNERNELSMCRRDKCSQDVQGRISSFWKAHELFASPSRGRDELPLLQHCFAAETVQLAHQGMDGAQRMPTSVQSIGKTMGARITLEVNCVLCQLN